MDEDLIAVSVCFVVTIDGKNIGAFNSCEGLGCEVMIEQREVGGNNGMVLQLPTRLKYPNVKLTRPITKATADKIPMWLTSLAKGVQRKTATIEARTAMGEVIVAWGLTGVVPVRWTGPQFTLDSPKVATETLELAHHGFTGPGWGG
ncbi:MULTISPECIES: phage tail protein [Planotetraspora]|jgi:phage tail-like protein|uniref:Phage tail protein n=2 Tax=Planotetraspora TaxID=58120 RepID=A0A8J3UKF4_9ACTN|nr:MULTISPECIES: phage tail protein [Planotetraspora]GII28156.1 phage tail protein [Planotetraspora mira]GII46883.1 phage tail protein [Planotetraspora silvatica]